MSNDPEEKLLRHLQALARRESWRTYELPEGIAERPAAILRLLDKHGWIEVHLWERADRNPRPFDNPHNFVIRRNRHITWFSPLESPLTAGTWDAILTKCTGELAPEVRLTELGRAKLDEVTLAGTNPEKKLRGRRADTDPGHRGRIASWVFDRTVTPVKWVFKHIVVQVIVGLIVAALVAWLTLG